MIRNRATAAIVLGGALLATGGRARADDPAVPIGRQIADLEFVDIRSLPRCLADFGPKCAFVLVFISTTCPLVRRYLPELDRLERQFRGRGVQFLALDVGDDSIAAIAALALEHGVEFPFGKDRGAACARALGARRTPEVAVLDGERRLRYRGRIDDQYRLGGARPAPARRELREALEDLLGGREVAVPQTPVDGCLIPRAAAPRHAGRVTFAEHVAPLLAEHCQGCHRPGGDAPFPLQTFRQVADLGETIAEVVQPAADAPLVRQLRSRPIRQRPRPGGSGACDDPSLGPGRDARGRPRGLAPAEARAARALEDRRARPGPPDGRPPFHPRPRRD